MKKTNKKGFTIVELVIVIAIIAILAAVLIPTFSSLIKRANVSKDQQLVRNLNTALIADKAINGKHETMTAALNAVKESGFDVATINSKKASDNEILWDSENDIFCYLNDGEIEYLPENKGADFKELDSSSSAYWCVVNATDEPVSCGRTGKNWSVYLASSTVSEITVSTGVDVGNCDNITSVTYENTTGAEKDVVIRTNGGSLTINDTNPGSKQIHYGTLANAEITTGSDCFYTHGKIAYMDLKQGKAVADNGGVVALMKAASGTEAEKINGGIIYIPDDTSNSDIELTSQNLTTLGYVVENEKINATAETKAANVYEISSKAELVAFRDSWNKGEVMAIVPFKLTANIDISGENWTPIGNWGHPFNGTFDGNCKTISGLTAVGTLGSDGVYNIGGTIGFGECYGFIGIVGEGNTEVKDLTFTNVNINLVNGTNVGAVIGFAPELNKGYDGDTIDSVGTLTLSGVTASGEINAKKHVGGLVGDSRTTGDVTFTNCVNNINITSTLGGQTGGIIGYANNCDKLTLTNSKNNGNITVTGTGVNGVAGLVGRVAGASVDVEISNCESNGNISSTGNISGVIDVEGQGLSSLSISNTKVTGLVVSTGAYDAYVLHGVPSGNPTITHTSNTFTGVIEANKGSETTLKNAKLNDVTTNTGYALARIYKVQNWGDVTEYNVAGGKEVWYNNPVGVHEVGYVVYDTNGEWTQIEGKSIEYMAVGEGYYVFRVNGSDIYARYTENPETDYRTLSQHPNHGQVIPN